MSDEDNLKKPETEKPSKETKKTDKPVKPKKGFFKSFFLFLTTLLWVFAAIIGTMPWWLNSPYVPEQVKPYLPPLPAQKLDTEYNIPNLVQDINELNNKVNQIENVKLVELASMIEQFNSAGTVINNDEMTDPIGDVMPEIATEESAADNKQPIDDIKGLQTNLADLSSKVDELVTKSEAFKTSIAAIETENAKQKEIAQKKAEEKEAETNLKEGLNQSLEQKDQALAVIASASLLEDAFNYGAPYKSELEVLESIFITPENYTEQLELLEKNAETGIKPLAKLIKEFNDIAPSAAWASIKIKQDGFIGKIVARLKTLVSFRRTGDKAPEDSTESIIYNAERLVNNGSISEAVKELETLKDEDAIKLVEPWLTDAKAYMETKSTLRKIIMQMVEKATKTF